MFGYKALIDADPQNAPALHLFGVGLLQMGDAHNAVQRIRAAIAVDPGPAEPWANLGLALDACARPEAAANALKEAARRAPRDPAIWANLAGIELNLGRRDEGEASARRALATDDRHAPAWYQLALALQSSDRVLEALDAASRAAGIAPDEPAFAGFKAQLEAALDRRAAAKSTLDAALARQPTSTRLRFQRAGVHESLGEFAAAVRDYQDVVQLDPDRRRGAVATRVSQAPPRRLARAARARGRSRRDGCRRQAAGLALRAAVGAFDARAAAPLCRDLVGAAADGRRPGAGTAAGRSGTEAAHRLSRRPTSTITPPCISWPACSRRTTARASRRTRTPWGIDDGSAYRARARAAIEHFLDVRDAGHDAIAQRIADDGIDVLVDLKGYTGESRRPRCSRCVRRRCRCNWLGYPGTMAAPFIDWIVADGVLIPPGDEAGYGERVVRLPDSYQANDRRQPIADTAMTRAQWGLPDGGIRLRELQQALQDRARHFRGVAAHPRSGARRGAVAARRPRREGVAPRSRRGGHRPVARRVRPQGAQGRTPRAASPRRPLSRHADVQRAHHRIATRCGRDCRCSHGAATRSPAASRRACCHAMDLPELVMADEASYVQARDHAGGRDRGARLRAQLAGPGRDSALFDPAALRAGTRSGVRGDGRAGPGGSARRHRPASSGVRLGRSR